MLNIYGIGIKDLVLLLAGITCVYLAYMWLRLMQVRRKKQKRTPQRAQLVEPKAAAPKIDLIDDSLDDAEEDQEDQMVYAKPKRQQAPNPDQSSAAEIPPGFSRMVAESQQRLVQSQARELEMLREQVTDLQRRQADMQDEIDRLKAASHVSPLYNEAVSMAQSGLNAEGIAVRCGISIAEAQLVAALANKPEADDAGEFDEDYHGQTAARHAA